MGNDYTWQQLLAKHGPWALGCAVMGFVIYTFVLTPSQREREAFIETSIKNAESMEVVAGNTETVATTAKEISASIIRQENTQMGMRDELEKQSDLRHTAMETMSAFAEEMRAVNPANGVKLDVLLKKAETTDDNIKLDIIIERIEELKEGTPPEP